MRDPVPVPRTVIIAIGLCGAAVVGIGLVFIARRTPELPSASTEARTTKQLSDSEVLPLVHSAGAGDLDEVKRLLKNGTEIDLRNDQMFGQTPLLAATSSGNLDLAIFLVKQGANVNLAERHGRTALMMAAAHGDRATNLVKVLLEHGADVTLKDDNELHPLTALDWAKGSEAWEIVKMLEEGEFQRGQPK